MRGESFATYPKNFSIFWRGAISAQQSALCESTMFIYPNEQEESTKNLEPLLRKLAKILQNKKDYCDLINNESTVLCWYNNSIKARQDKLWVCTKP